MLKKYQVEISQNGWEYTGFAWIECVGSVVRDETCDNAIYADNVRIVFDEEIGKITEVK